MSAVKDSLPTDSEAVCVAAGSQRVNAARVGKPRCSQNWSLIALRAELRVREGAEGLRSRSSALRAARLCPRFAMANERGKGKTIYVRPRTTLARRH